jgi:hypothetical protein
MARHSRKKKNGLEGNEFLFSGKKFRVSVPEDLHVLKDHDDQRLVKVQACWGSFGVFIPYNAIIDPKIDCLALVNKPIAFKASRYKVADIFPLPAWTNGAMVMPRLKVDSGERENVPMLIMDLGAKYDMIFGRQWLEESNMPLDCNKVNLELPSSMSSSCDQIERTRLRNQESAVQKDQKDIPIPSRGSALDIDVGNEKAVSVIVTPSCSYRESCKIQGATDVATLPCQEEDPYRSRIPTAHSDMSLRVPVVRLPDQRGNDLQPHRPGGSSSPFGIPNAPVTASKDWTITDEDMSAVRPVIRFPGHRREVKDPDEEDINLENISAVDAAVGALLPLETSEHDESQRNRIADSIVAMPSPEDPSFCQEKLPNRLLDEPNDKDPCYPYVRLPAYVRLPEMGDFRFHRPDGSFFCTGVPETPIATSKDRIIMDKDPVAGLRVRLPGHPHIDTLSLFPSFHINAKEEWPYCFLDVDEDSSTEATWNNALYDCDVKSSESDTFNDIPNDDDPGFKVYEVLVATPLVEDGVSDSEVGPLENLSREEPGRAMELNYLCLGSTGVLDNLGYEKELNALQLIEVVNQPAIQRPNNFIDAFSLMGVSLDLAIPRSMSYTIPVSEVDSIHGYKQEVASLRLDTTLALENALWTLSLDMVTTFVCRLAAWVDTGWAKCQKIRFPV